MTGNGGFSEDHLYFLTGSDPNISSLEFGGLFGNDPIVSNRAGLVTLFEFAPVPLPPAIWMLGAAMGTLLYSRRKTG